MFTLLQELNLAKYRDDAAWQLKYHKRLAEAVQHIQFCCQLYKMRMEAGRYFIHEQPWTARSWDLPAIKEISEDVRVTVVQAHQCQFGLMAQVKGQNSRIAREEAYGLHGEQLVCRSST